MSRKTTIILALLLLLAGVGVMAYPSLSNYINQRNGSYAIQELNKQIMRGDSERTAGQRCLAEAYNAKISGADISDAFDSDNDSAIYEDYYDILEYGNGMMGYIQIPKISVNLPIYHGVGDTVLAKGVGHMPQSAFPIGGEGNHAILTGHTGFPSAELFTDLTELEAGDTFYINILEETIAYEVDQIKVVLPNETENLAAVPGKDYCTLVTCTPYGINSHRLLVRGHRTELAQKETLQQLQAQIRQLTMPLELVAALAVAGILLVSVIVLIFRKDKE